MDTHAPHSALAKALATLGQRPPGELAKLAGGPALKQVVDIGGERIEIELLVSWDSAAHDAVRISGHAHGPGEGTHAHAQDSVITPVRDAGRHH